MSPDAVAPLAFVAVLSVFAAILLLWQAGRVRASDTLRRRLGQLARQGDGADLVKGEVGTLARMVAESGLGWTTGQLIARIAVAALVGFVLGLVLGSGFLAATLAIGGCLALWILVRKARARRLAQCDEQMPQALEIMALALRAGHALPGALQLAAQESPAPLCHELRRAHDEHALGRPIAEVLIALGERLPGCAAVETFVVAVAVLQETGGNLIGVIDRIVDNARARAGYQARLRALTAEGRQSARLLALLPGAFFILVMASDPSYGRMLVADSGGRSILVVAIGLWMAGILWTRRLVRPMQ